MRVAIVVSIVAAAAPAAIAQPGVTPAATTETPPPPDYAPLSGTLRAGFETSGSTDQSGHLGGNGVGFELEGEVRRRHVGFALAVGFSTYHDSNALLDDLPSTTGDLGVIQFEIATRLRFHFGRTFFGIGLWGATAKASGTSTQPGLTPPTMPYENNSVLFAPELHLGVDLAKVGPVELQLFGAVAAIAIDTAGMSAARVMLGARF